MRFFLLSILAIPSLLQAQQGIYVDLFGGFSNYQGDLQEKRFTTEHSKAALGIGCRYYFTEKLAARVNFTYATVAASDAFNTKEALRNRNLNFKSHITELNLLLDFTLLSLENYRLSPYIFGGVAAYHFNPFTYDSEGVKYFLKPLSTEGQGLTAYPDRKTYPLTQISIPFGGGLRWRLSDNMMLSYEIGLRKTSTDYLDDVSTTYVTKEILELERNNKAVELSFRGTEKDNTLIYPDEGVIRGGSKFKDWYYMSGLTLSIQINTRGSNSFRGFGGNRGNMGCPKKPM